MPHLLIDSRWSYIQNRATGRVLSQVEEDGNIVPADLAPGIKRQHWRTIRTGNGYHLIQNRMSKNVLDHFGGQRIAAEDRVWNNPYHQWMLVDVGDGFKALKNAETGMVIDFYFEQSIQAFNDDVTSHHHQWRFVRADTVEGAEHSASSSDEEEESPGVKVKKIKLNGDSLK